jgi:signal transduction histidine kinase
VDTAAATHGTLRHMNGFSLLQLTSEYRSLRATVLRLWLPQIREFDEAVLQDMVRFNGTIDQALAESVLTYSDEGERTRDTFLAVLGHDLRTPLAVVAMAGNVLGGSAISLADIQQTATHIRRSAATMNKMINDLLAYARMQLGGPLPIQGKWLDMSRTCEESLQDARATHPESLFAIRLSGDLSCNYDAARLQQLFSNLLNNAAQFSPSGNLIELLAHGDADAVLVQVRNKGVAIPEESLKAIFEPLVQLPTEGDQDARPNTSIGLGLFIAREITAAHGGSINAESTPEGITTFTVRIPKTASAQELGRLTAGRSA